MIALARTGRSALKSVIQQAILDSEEMEDLRGGKLQGQLGLSPSLAANVPQDIAEAVADSIELIPRNLLLPYNFQDHTLFQTSATFE